jgi:hypothetical protein
VRCGDYPITAISLFQLPNLAGSGDLAIPNVVVLTFGFNHQLPELN